MPARPGVRDFFSQRNGDGKDMRLLQVRGRPAPPGRPDAGRAPEGLQRLYLGGTRVTDKGLTRLHGCEKLRLLDVRSDPNLRHKTQVTERGLAAFHDAVPGCRIDHDGGVIPAKDG